MPCVVREEVEASEICSSTSHFGAQAIKIGSSAIKNHTTSYKCHIYTGILHTITPDQKSVRCCAIFRHRSTFLPPTGECYAGLRPQLIVLYVIPTENRNNTFLKLCKGSGCNLKL